MHTPETRDSTRDWARAAFEQLSVSCRGPGQQWHATGAGILAAGKLGAAACKPHWTDNPQTGEQLYQEVLILMHNFQGSQQISQPGDPTKGLRTPREFDFKGQWDVITELPHYWVNRLLEGTNKTLCSPELRRKEQWNDKRLSQMRLWGSRSLLQRRGSTVVGLGVGALNTAVLAQVLLKDCHYAYLRPQYRQRTKPHPPLENWIKDLLSMALPIRARARFPHSPSLPSGGFLRGQTEWKPQSQKN